MDYNKYIYDNKTFNEYNRETCKSMYDYKFKDLILNNIKYNLYTNCIILKRNKEKTEYDKQVKEYKTQKKDIQNIFNTISNDDLEKNMYNALNDNLNILLKYKKTLISHNDNIYDKINDFYDRVKYLTISHNDIYYKKYNNKDIKDIKDNIDNKDNLDNDNNDNDNNDNNNNNDNNDNNGNDNKDNKDNIHNKLNEFIKRYNINSKCYNIIPNKNQKILHHLNSNSIFFCVDKYHQEIMTKIKIDNNRNISDNNYVI